MKSTIILGFFFFLSCPLSALASCGLNGCPIEKHAVPAHTARGILDTAITFGFTDATGTPADYWISQFRAEGAPVHWLRFSFLLSVAEVSQGGESHSGLSDIVAEALFIPLRWNRNMSNFIIGNQLEFPTGDEEKGLSSGHYEILPYMSVHLTLLKTMTYAQIGGRFSLSSHELGLSPHSHAFGIEDANHSHSHGSVLDPHDDQEFLFRTGVIYPFSRRISGGLSFLGQTVLASENRGETFASVLPEFNVELLNRLWAGIRTELPITASKRFDWRAGMSLSYLF